jgi:carboxyl-terminal processing protease
LNDVSETTNRHRGKWWTTKLGIVAVCSVLLCTGAAAYAADPDATASKGNACTALPDTPEAPPLPDATPTTLATLQQAYNCILDNAYAGAELDTRVLLRYAFKRVTEELIRRNIDQPTATISNLTGNRKTDLESFTKVMQTVFAGLPDNAEARQAVAAAALNGMVESLDDNHAHWDDRRQQKGALYSLGFREEVSGRGPSDIAKLPPPMFIKDVRAGGPADRAGLKPGDILVAANDVPLVSNGQMNLGATRYLWPQNDTDTVRLTVQRPSTGKTWTVQLRAELVTAPTEPKADVTLLPGDIVKVKIPGFMPGVADEILGKIAQLRKTTTLRGVVFDVRGNGGGRVEEINKLTSSFIHNQVLSRDCDIDNHCTVERTDDTVALLNLPMSVVTDWRCLSACEGFVASAKFLNLGKVVGTRTGGGASGLQKGFLLNDNSVLITPTMYRIFTHGEAINEIGIPVDYNIPLTAEDLSFGRDPAVDKAHQLLAS